MINEKLLKTLVNETINILLENRESKNINLARKELKNHGYEGEENKDTLDLIRNKVPNVRLGEYKFFLGVVRLWLNNELISETDEKSLNKLLPYIASEAHINEYDYNLNNLSLNDLKEKFETIRINDIEKQKKESNSKTYTKNENYEIIRIPDFETATQYSQYTKWCVTIDKRRFDDYTDGGSGAFYFCLRKGFENEKEVVGENCPLDNYGLSMIAVSVTEDGAPNTITCRWNHANKGNDHIMSVEELEELLGVNFFQTFLPYTEEELEARGIISHKKAIKMLEQGIPLEDVFDDIQYIGNDITKARLNKKWLLIDENDNLINNNKIWFDHIENFYGADFAVVKLNNKWSFIDKNGNLIRNGKLWFDYTLNYVNGFARVELNNKWSFINSNSDLIGNGNIWFDYILDFVNGFARVQSNNKWSFIDENGKLIGNGKLWFDNAEDFEDKFARVELNNKCSLIDQNGNLIGNGKLWVDNIGYFWEGLAQVELDSRRYYVDENGNFYNYNTKKPIPSPINSIQEKTYFKLNKLIKEELNNYLQNNLL